MKRSPLFILFITVFLDLLGFGIVLPLLPLYAETFGASPFVIGLLVTSYSLMQFLTAPLWGRLSDRVGRRPVILLGLLGAFAAYLTYGLAGALWLLFLGRIVAGIFGGNLAAAQAYIADSTTGENRARGMGLIGAAFGLGFIFGPAIGGALSPFGFGVPALAAAGLALANGLWALIALPESLPPERRGRAARRRSRWRELRDAFSQPSLSPLLGLFFLIPFAFVGLESTFSLLSKYRFDYMPSQVGYLFAYIGVLTTLIQMGLIGPLARRLGEARMIILGTLALAIGLIALPFAPNLLILLLGLAVIAFGMGICNPALTSLLSRRAAAGAQGVTQGVGQSLSSLARMVGPIGAGYLFEQLGPPAPYVAGGLFMLGAFGLSFRLRRPARPAPATISGEIA